MPYATALNLIEHCDSDELPPVLDRSIPRVIDDEQLRAAAAQTGAIAEPLASAIARMNSALVDASQFVDGYCAARYVVPFASPPSMVKRWTMDIARWLLYGIQVPETVQKRYDATVSSLKAVASGALSLGAPQGTAEAPSGGSVVLESTMPVWRRGESDGFL